MAIQTYADLALASANWMGRAGNADFTGNFQDFVTLTEDWLNNGNDDPDFPCPPLRVAQMEVPATTLTVLASSNSVLLPPDYLAMRSNYITATPHNIRLRYLAPAQMTDTVSNQLTGPQQFFTIKANQLILPAAVTTTNTLILDYYQRIPALTTSNTVNWLLTASPRIYLSGTQLQGALFVRDMSDAQMHAKSFTGAIRAFQKQDSKNRWAAGPLVQVTDTGSP